MILITTACKVGAEAARLLGERVVPVRVLVRNPQKEEKQAMINAGVPATVAEDNAKALSLFAQGDADYITDDVPALLGRPARTFERFATDYAEAFS